MIARPCECGGQEPAEVKRKGLSGLLVSGIGARGKRFTNTNLRWPATTPLLSSGLLGPVVIFEV